MAKFLGFSFFFMALLLLNIEPVRAQDTTVSKVDGSIMRKSAESGTEFIHDKVDVMAEPPGGMAAFRQWVGSRYRYPQEAIDNGVRGQLELSFVVEKDGSLTDIKVLRDLGFGTGQEAVRLLKASPKWSPAIQNGRVVRTLYRFPIWLGLQ